MSLGNCKDATFDNLNLDLKLNYIPSGENERKYYYTYTCKIGYTPNHDMPSNDVICVQKNNSSEWIDLNGNYVDEPECHLYTELIAGIVVVTVLVAIIIAIVYKLTRIKRRLARELRHHNEMGSSCKENPYISPRVQRENSIPPHSPLPRPPQRYHSRYRNRGFSGSAQGIGIPEVNNTLTVDDDYALPKSRSELVVAESVLSFRSTHDYDNCTPSEGDSNSSRSLSPISSCDQGIVLPTVTITRDSDELSSSADEGNENKIPASYRESIALPRADGSMPRGDSQSEL